MSTIEEAKEKKADNVVYLCVDIVISYIKLNYYTGFYI